MKKLLTTLAVIIGSLSVSQAQLVITEIMYNSPETGTDSLEFIEIYNAGSSTVDLQGHYITFGGSIRDSFATSYPLASGALVVTCVNDTALINQFSLSFTPRQWRATGALNNSPNAGVYSIKLFNSTAQLQDSVAYDDAAPWPTTPDGAGASLILCNTALDNNNGTNWVASAVSTGITINNFLLKGSPGVLESCAGPVVLSFPLYDIATVTTNDTSGVADSLGVRCEIRGIVHSIDFDGNAGYDITLIDYNHNGITVFSSTDKNGYTAPAMGDSLHVKGVVAQFNSLTQFTVDTIALILPGQNMLTPINITTALAETEENKLVRIASVTLVNPIQWTGTGTGFNVDVTNGSNSWTIRIDNDCVWYGLPAPTGTMDIIGTVNQFDTLSPFTSGYQIRPRIITDILVQGGVPTVFFTPNSATVNENAGTVTLTLGIANANANATSVDVQFNAASTSTGADYTNFISPTTVTFPANSSANQQITIDIVDDALIEGTETIVLEILNINNSGLLGSDSLHTITINDNDVAPTPLYDLVITEFMYNNPLADSVEFIEIYNNDSVTVNLAGYQVTSGVFFTFPSYSLAPGSYVLVCQDSLLFQQRFGIAAFRWNTGNSLNNTTEGIVLKNNLGTVLDSIQYASTAPWPVAASGNGPSAQLCDVNSDNNLGSNWGAGNNPTGVIIGGLQILATPGAANTWCRPPYPVQSIGNIDNTNTNGEPDSLGLEFEIRGIVHCGDFRVGTGLDFYLINFNNEGIKVFSSFDRGYVVNEGDSLHVQGRVNQGNGVTEFLVDTLFLRSSGNAVVAPTVITAALTENNEGSFIRLNNVSLSNATQWTGAGAGFNVDVTNGTTTWQMRIDDATDLYSQAAPTGSFNVYGFGGQFDPSLPYTSGYQLVACNSSITPIVGTEMTENKAVQIYPNPVYSELNISAEEIQTIIISNMLGQEIIRMDNINSNFQTISTASLPAGMYNAAVMSKGQMSIQQFVKK
jgi:hypothetical protein